MLCSTRRVELVWRLGLSIFAGVALLSSARAEDKLQYNRDIRPILSENCFACHGPDSAARKADLRLDQRDAAVDYGAIVPGDVESSIFVERIFAESPDELMPPPDSHKKLTPEQRELLKRWVQQGAEYQPHWSFIRPVRPAVPEVKQQAWVRNPIDAFVLARLEQNGLKPAPEADRRELARRVTLDLTGLPPEPEAVEAFVLDQSPDAYEKLVDRLLQSPRWGEHRARYWLDAARYADTHGIHFDNFREMWTYRDWVTAAFNKNMPFDQFTVENLAGDLLPNATLEQKIGSGFNRCNITTNEGGAIAEEYLVHYTRDRTETTSAVFMGLTAGCAVCHDHKFDPLSQREFYEMAAFFNNSTQAAMDGNIKDTPPIVFVPAMADRARWDELTGLLEGAKADTEARRQVAKADYDSWLAGQSAETLAGHDVKEGLHFRASLSEGKGEKVQSEVDGQPREFTVSGKPGWIDGHVGAKGYRVRPDGNLELAGVGDFERDQAFSFAAWVKLPKGAKTGAVFARMDDTKDYRGWDLWVENQQIGAHIIHKWPEDALKVVANNPVTPDAWHHIVVAYDGSSKASGVSIYVDGLQQPTTPAADALKNTIRTEVPLKLGQRHTQSRLNNVAVQDLRLYRKALSDDDVAQVKMVSRATFLASKPADQRSDAEKLELFDWWLSKFDGPYKAVLARTTALKQEQAAIQGRGTIAHVMNEKPEPAVAFVLHRGEYDKRRDEVKPDTPNFLPTMPDDLPKNRLGFAQWLLRPDHPLTSRVTVNRFWQQVFGTGLVATSGDFGITGQMPTHPELLDWLAVEFRESGWDVKRFFRLMVTSAAYRQSTAVTPEKLAKDEKNRLISRGPRFRMDAEMIRDYALCATGLLVDKIGGPSVKPYQPEGVWEAVAMICSNTRDYKRDTGESLYRRSMYTFWKRSAPPASMDIFNAPAREVCAVQRERTNTPLQALVTLNDEQFVEAARHLAQSAILKAGEASQARLNFIAHRLLLRPLRAEELQIIEPNLQGLLEYYTANVEDAQKLIAVGESQADPTVDPTQLAAWTMLVNELMNLDEVLNK